MIRIQIKRIRIHQYILKTESCEWPRIRISYLWIRIHHLETQNYTKWFESKSKWFESISVFWRQKVVKSQGFESPTNGFESIFWKLKNCTKRFESLPTDSNPTDGKSFLTASFWRIKVSNGYNHSPTAITDSKGINTPKIFEELDDTHLEKQDQHKSKGIQQF